LTAAPDLKLAVNRVTGDAPWPEPDMRAVEDDRAPPPAVDNDALPAGWGDWVTAEAEARGCPRDYVAAGLIGGASAWIGNARHVGATSGQSVRGAPYSGRLTGQQVLFSQPDTLLERPGAPVLRRKGAG
jgi:hypothetical protein